MSDCTPVYCLWKDLPPMEAEELVKKLAKAGAKEALAEIGLADADAGSDVRSLRDMLKDWRGVRSGAIAQIGRVIGYIAILWIALKLGFANVINFKSFTP